MGSGLSCRYSIHYLMHVSVGRNVCELRYVVFMNDEKIINIVRAILGSEQDRSP